VTFARRLSLRWIVPSLMAAMLAAVVTLFGAIAYRAVRSSTLRTASARLRTTALTFARPTPANLLWTRPLIALASNSDVAEIAVTSGTHVSATARRAFARLLPDTGQTLFTDVRDLSGKVLYSMSRATSTLTSDRMSGAPRVRRTNWLLRHSAGGGVLSNSRVRDSLRLGASFGDSIGVSPLYERGGTVLYERAVPIRDEGRLLGHLVQVERFTVSTSAIRTLTNLIGKDADLLVGNADGSLWTDSLKPVSHPAPSDSTQRYRRDGRVWLSAAARLSSAPWFAVVDFPQDVALAPVRALLWRFVLIGVVVVALATIAAERLSRRLTVPITQLTTAAEAIAGGDLSGGGLVLTRRDELGRLSHAFDSMADSIRRSRDTLEAQISTRTDELQKALVQLRETQDELVRKERLATLGQLSSSIGHELRNPLGVMTNALYYLDLVLRDASPKVKDHLAMLRSQVRLSEAIVSGLLDYARSRAPHRSVIAASQLIDDQLARTVIPTSIRVERVPPAEPADLDVDPMQIGQVLVNLFSNAVQAMNGKSGVLLIGVTVSSGRVRIDVADSGPGIAPDLLEKVFEPLFSTKTRGIGLGLAVARTLTRANDGDLTAANRPEGGAVFTLDLPGAHSQASVGAPIDASSAVRVSAVGAA
jgi:two-component system, NtrC family, sensor histidine kinase HydH